LLYIVQKWVFLVTSKKCTPILYINFHTLQIYGYGIINMMGFYNKLSSFIAFFILKIARTTALSSSDAFCDAKALPR